MTYRRLTNHHGDPRAICPVHSLLKYPKITAQLDAERMRERAAPGTAESMAQAQRCTRSGEAGEVWHIYIPSRGRMATIRRKLRKTGQLPPVTGTR